MKRLAWAIGGTPAVFAIGFLGITAIVSLAQAQPYPTKPVRIFTQFAAGASGDTTVRIMSAPFSEIIGQPVIIENRAGAGGVLAAEAVARAAPDGYTLLAGSSSTQIIRIFLSKSIPFDPVRDFTPITQITESVPTIVLNPRLPVNSLGELIDYARRNPGKIAFGTSGIGSDHHLSGEEIKQLMKLDMLHVPYKAGAQALVDVISGQLPMAFVIHTQALPHIRSGKARALAVVKEKRFALLPEVPTVTEVIPAFEVPPSWTGLLGPAGLPSALLSRIAADAIRAMNLPETRARYAEGGQEVIASTPEEFTAKIRRNLELVGRIVKAAGIQAE
ncbi:MAG: Bug family tripartite tricarboxylate transporter substrate binding protein [Burkholderiales bacterium]